VTATTLVLDGGDAGARPGFELRLEQWQHRAARSRTTSKERRAMSIEEQAKGKLDEAKGRGEQAQGDLTGDNKKKGEGLLHETEGKARQAGDKARDAIHDLTK
jgi:uncharacterized protein YjbJ (UPF0337 family)